MTDEPCSSARAVKAEKADDRRVRGWEVGRGRSTDDVPKAAAEVSEGRPETKGNLRLKKPHASRSLQFLACPALFPDACPGPMFASDHGREQAVGDGLFLIVRLAIGVSVAAIGAPRVLGGVEIEMPPAGVAVRAQQPALEV